MTILALDLASTTGWATASPPYTVAPTALEVAAGAQPPRRFSGVKPFGYLSSDYAKMMAAFHRWLDEMVAVHAPTALVYEAALPHIKNPNVARIALGMAAIVEMTAGERELRVWQVHNARLKKYATGSGNAKKGQMMEAAKERGWKFTDDNECDALWLADYACHCLTVGK